MALDVGRVDILLEVSLLFSNLEFPITRNLQAVYRLFVYLKQAPQRQLYFNQEHPDISEDQFHKLDWEYYYRDAAEAIPLDMPLPRSKTMTSHCFVDANHAGYKATIISMTGTLIFFNRAPIIWHAKRQNEVETYTFGSEFTAMKNADEFIAALRYKLRMFRVTINGTTNMFCDN